MQGRMRCLLAAGRGHRLTACLRFHVVATAPAAISAFVFASPARADPQASLGLTVGGALRNVAGADPEHGALHMGARADVLFFRSRGSDMGLGPYAEAATLGFDVLDVGGGVAWLVPLRDQLPFVFSGGAFARDVHGAWLSGLDGTVFFGSRSYNFHSWYGLSAGVFAQAKWIPGVPAADLVLGARVDAELLALPWILLYQAVAR